MATGQASPAADSIRRILDALVRERQQLRALGTTGPQLEANRLAIVYWQQALGSALVDERTARAGRAA